jgi:hypothetical protein
MPGRGRLSRRDGHGARDPLITSDLNLDKTLTRIIGDEMVRYAE